MINLTKIKFIAKDHKKINIILYSFSIVLLLISCFFKEAFWPLLAIYVFFLPFLSISDIVSYGAFLYCFSCLSPNIVHSINGNILFAFITILALVCKAIILIKNKQLKINYIALLFVEILLLYVALPIHNVAISSFTKYAIFICLIYLCYQLKSFIKYKQVILMLCLGIIISSSYSFLYPLSKNLQLNMAYVVINNFVRFSGLITHPNAFALLCLTTLSGLFVLKLKDEIELIPFLALSTIIATFGYLSISRIYLLSCAIAIFSFLIFGIIKFKKKFTKTLAFFCLFMILITAISYIPTKIYLVRLNILSESTLKSYYNTYKVGTTIYETGRSNSDLIDNSLTPYSNEWWNKVYNGEIRYDPGRDEIWKLNFNDWKSSTKNVLFGKGISTPNIGRMHAHSLYLNELRHIGIFGFVICFAIIIYWIIKSKLKNSIIPLLVIMLPFLVFGLVESCYCYYLVYCIFILSIQTQQKLNTF